MSQTLPSCLHSRVRFRADFLLLFALCIAIVGLWIPRMAGPLDLRWDAGVYYVLGTSIAEGKGYRLVNEPGEIEATLYPPFCLCWLPFLKQYWGQTTRSL